MICARGACFFSDARPHDFYFSRKGFFFFFSIRGRRRAFIPGKVRSLSHRKVFPLLMLNMNRVRWRSIMPNGDLHCTTIRLTWFPRYLFSRRLSLSLSFSSFLFNPTILANLLQWFFLSLCCQASLYKTTFFSLSRISLSLSFCFLHHILLPIHFSS